MKNKKIRFRIKSGMTIEKHKPAMSLVELIIAMAIFALIVLGLTGMVVGGYTALDRSGEQTEASALAQEGIEAVRSIKNQAWNNLSYSTSGVQIVGGQWTFTGEGTVDTIGKYTRTISFSNVCLNSDNKTIAACPADHVDPLSKMVKVDVSWPAGAYTSHVIRQQYLTDYLGHFFTQTDWAGSSGQSIWSAANKYFSDNGSINTSTAGQVSLILASASTSTASHDWTYTTPTDYSYTSSLITVTSSMAQLVGTSTSDANTKGLWHMDDASGNFVDSSGNGYNLNIQFGTASTAYATSGKFSTAVGFATNGGREVSTTTATGLAITGPITVEAWVYMTSAGSVYYPIAGKWDDYWQNVARSYILAVNEGPNAVFSVSQDGTSINSIQSSVSMNTLLNQWVHLAGVYDGTKLYIFVNGALSNSTAYTSGIYNGTKANFSIGSLEHYNGNPSYFKGKIDEVRVSNIARWTSAFTPQSSAYSVAGPTTYPSSSPSIYQTSTFATSSILNWSGFTETATKNGGSISYQLTPDNTNWWWWNGSAWATTTGANYNTSSVIAAHISTFTTSTGQINYKAFLTSSGSQLVQLDNINIAYVKSGAATCVQIKNPYSYDFTFANSTNYTYNSNEIGFAAGQAQLNLVNAGGNTMGLWHMNDSSGGFVDSSGHGYNLNSAFGTVSGLTYDSSGKFSTAVNFDGNGGYIVATTSAPNLALTGAMTVEAWVYQPSYNSGLYPIAGKWSDAYPYNSGSYLLSINESGQPQFSVSADGTTETKVVATSQMPYGQWNHLAGVYDGSKIYIFINGTLSTSTAYSSGIYSGPNANFMIGGAQSYYKSGPKYFTGKIDDVRVSNVARWTSSFTPPTSSYTFGNTAGLWHLDDASGDFVDAGPNGYHLNIGGTPSYGSQSNFGTAATFWYSTPGVGRGIANASAPNLNITGNLTTEAWVWKNTAAASVFESIAGRWDDSSNNKSYLLAIDPGSHPCFFLSTDGNNYTSVCSASTLPLSQWVHVAGVYDYTNGYDYLFVNGIMVASSTYASPTYVGTANFMIGSTQSLAFGSSASSTFSGTIDEVRVSNAALWTSNFTPQSSAYTVSESGNSSYPTDSPAVNQTSGFSTTTTVASWTGFTETATKNGGSISYQLSSDGGSTWKYWSGSAWATAGAGNYNSASVINTNIAAFPTSTNQINAKAFLTSNGSQLVQLDNINISYVANGGLYCGSSGSLISSAIDMSTSSPVSNINWDQDLSSCTPNCSIQMQLRTAPDSSGAPGTWGTWYGATGPGTYFTNHWGTMTNPALNGNRWLQYQAFLTSSSTGNPILQEVRVDYQ